MDIGCRLPTQGPVATREVRLTFCREAEARAIASLWVSDHVIFPRTASGQYPGGLTHVVLDFPREIRPAVDAARGLLPACSPAAPCKDCPVTGESYLLPGRAAGPCASRGPDSGI